MALVMVINSFQGWSSDEQRREFVKHLMGEVEDTGPLSQCYEKMTVTELKEECKTRGIKGYNGKKKDTLIELIKQGPKTKSKKDKTKEVVLSKNFYKAEFAESFRKDPSAMKAPELKKAVGKSGFDIADKLPPVERDGKMMTNTSFGAKKDDMIEILTTHLDTLDIDELRAEDDEKRSAETPVASDAESVDTTKLGDRCVEEDSSSDEDDEPLIKVEEVEAPKKETKKETKKKKSVEVEVEVEKSESKKARRRNKARKEAVDDLPSEDDFAPCAADFHAE